MSPRLVEAVEDLISFVEDRVGSVVEVDHDRYCGSCGEPEGSGDWHAQGCDVPEVARRVAAVRTLLGHAQHNRPGLPQAGDR